MPFRVDGIEQKAIRVDGVALDLMRVDSNVVYKKSVTPSSVKVASASITSPNSYEGNDDKLNNKTVSITNNSITVNDACTMSGWTNRITRTITVNLTGDGDGNVKVVGTLDSNTYRFRCPDNDNNDDVHVEFTLGLQSTGANGSIPVSWNGSTYPFSGTKVVDQSVNFVNGKASFTITYIFKLHGANLFYVPNVPITFTFI
ncbi:MAG: hypothetical protein J1E64_10715 [Acetatifactor sp.]|nr:hypothetical protein [Acetatifactor sp.]